MEENWFIFKEDHHLGPFTAETLLTMLEEQEVSENVLVWKEGFDAWLPLKDCPEFQFEIEEDEGPPPLPSLPFEDEPIEVTPAAENFDQLMSDAESIRPDDLQPEVDKEKAERFWSDVDVEASLSKVKRELNPLEYQGPEPAFRDNEFANQDEIDEVVEAHHQVLEQLVPEEFEDEGPPPLPPLPEMDETDEEEQEYLFEQTDVYEDEVLYEPEEVYEEPELHHALDEVEAEQAQREKKADFLIHSAWAVACLTFILISLYLVFGIEQRKEEFTGLAKSDYMRLTNIANKATAGSLEKINFDVAVGSDLQSIWLASNRKGPAGLFLSMKSLDENILGMGPVLVTSTTELKDGVAAFDKFEIVEGARVYPGLYNLKLKVYDTSLKHKFFLFLKKVPFIGGMVFVNSFKGVADYTKQVLMFDGNLNDFKVKLAEFKKKKKEFKARPIKQRIEAYSTLTNLSKKIMQIYNDTQSKIKRGKDITKFESVYAREVSPLLQGIILDNIKKQRKIRNQNLTEDKEYDKLVMFGRKVGEFAADIVTEHRNMKKISSKKKRRLVSKYQKSLKRIEMEGESLVNQSRQLLRSL